MKILVTGANGQLGRAISRIAKKHVDDHYLLTDIDTLDITNADAVRQTVQQFRPDVLINCAAYTNVDQAEDNAKLAAILNTDAPHILAKAMAEIDGIMVHISTDYVFGGNQINTPCQEDAPVNPLGVYGKTKFDGEECVRSSIKKHIIIRTAWLYSEDGHNFMKTMLSLTERLDNINVVFDQTGTPTYAADLAQAIDIIIRHNNLASNWGTYHYSNEGVCSWFDFARHIGKKANHKAIVSPCHSNEFPSKVTRPAYSVLDKTKIKNTFGIDIPYWSDSANLCIKNLTENV